MAIKRFTCSRWADKHYRRTNAFSFDDLALDEHHLPNYSAQTLRGYLAFVSGHAGLGKPSPYSQFKNLTNHKRLTSCITQLRSTVLAGLMAAAESLVFGNSHRSDRRNVGFLSLKKPLHMVLRFNVRIL